MALAVASLSLVLSAITPVAGAAFDPYDLVILNGRVMDPESGLDAVRNVGISDGRIQVISPEGLQGRQTIDARGLVVAPGFIDMHEHGQEPRNYQFQARDGVTSSLELELGAADVDEWYAQREGKALINFGVGVGHIPVRMRVLGDPGDPFPSGAALSAAATDEQIALMRELIEQGLQRGALAVGMGINYTAAASHGEVVEMFRAAARYRAAVHVHLRYGGIQEPATGLAGLEEVIAAAASTGAPLHVVHITSMGVRDSAQLIAMVEGARRNGLDVTTECYPYTAASTGLESAIFAPGWQERLGITYS
ncbi:MAG: D-glutamate deacylase, partial [Gammaproteobacteria bacterium]